jgi:predicted metalloprotease with PDZ domain
VELTYRLKIENPSRHLLKVQIEGKRPKGANRLIFFQPRWCQGHYQGKNYDPFLRSFLAQNKTGEYLSFEKIKDGQFEVSWDQSELKGDTEGFIISYLIYCHSREMDFSCIDESHAYLFGANIFMGIQGQDLKNLEVFVEFPPLWSRINTSLEDISGKREVFCYRAKDFSELICTPMEIGCHETDGFRDSKIDFYQGLVGDFFPHGKDIKKDISNIVRSISPHIKNPKFNIINNFNSGFLSGIGLPSTSIVHLHGMKLADDKYYLKFLYKFCQTYIKSNLNNTLPEDIKDLSFSDEVHSKMLWMVEGLGLFLPAPKLFNLKIINELVFVKILENLFTGYLNNNGKKFQTLIESSQNLWTRKSDLSEDHSNYLVPTSLKGSIVIFFLSVHLHLQKKSLSSVLTKLCMGPYLNDEVIFSFIDDENIKNQLDLLLNTTEDVDLKSLVEKIGIKYKVLPSGGMAWPGLTGTFIGERVFIESVALDGPSYKGGLNIGDELLAINGKRVLKNTFAKISQYLMIDKYYQFLIRRGERILEAEVLIEKDPINFNGLEVSDSKLLFSYLKGI